MIKLYVKIMRLLLTSSGRVQVYGVYSHDSGSLYVSWIFDYGDDVWSTLRKLYGMCDKLHAIESYEKRGFKIEGSMNAFYYPLKVLSKWYIDNVYPVLCMDLKTGESKVTHRYYKASGAIPKTIYNPDMRCEANVDHEYSDRAI